MKALSMFALAAVLTATMPLVAQTVSAKDLTPNAIVATMKEKSAGQRQAYTAMVISSIASMPISDEEKVAKLVSAARALISGSKSGNTIGVIAEIYNSTPVQHLPAVAKMLTGNFDQALNKLSDQQMALYIEKIVGRAAAYIEASGCDSPAIRAGILSATFIDAATDKAAATAKVAEMLPTSVRAAAMAYAEDTIAGNTDRIAEGAGVEPEEISDAPAKDPDADNVVTVAEKAPEADAPTAEEIAQAKKDAADAEAIAQVLERDDVKPASVAAAEEAEDTTSSVAVPLLSRFSKDVTGILSDTITAALYDWEEIDITTLPTDPLSASLLGVGDPTLVPGDATSGAFLQTLDVVIRKPESPLYDGQR